MGYAITTRYAGPTNYRGSRVIATGPALEMGGRPTRATVEWGFGIGNPGARYDGFGDVDGNHRHAADELVDKLRAAGWHVALDKDDRGATLPDESGHVYLLRYGA